MINILLKTYNISKTSFGQDFFPDILTLLIVIYIFLSKISIIKSYLQLIYKYKSYLQLIFFTVIFLYLILPLFIEIWHLLAP